MDYRDEIKSYIAQAIDGVVNYSGENKEQNLHNWIEIATDRAIGVIIKQLPNPVDVSAKYELDPEKGLFVTIQAEQTPEAFKRNKEMMFHIAKYADDKGYNRYYQDIMQLLTQPYSPLQNEGMFANISAEGDN